LSSAAALPSAVALENTPATTTQRLV
jgi:hypothetical protein